MVKNTGGSGDLFNTPLASPDYHDNIMSMVYKRDFLREITNSVITEKITKCDQTVQIMKALEVIPWRPYQMNQQMLTPTVISLPLNNISDQSLKFDEPTSRYVSKHWQQFEERIILEPCYKSFVVWQREWVFTSMIAGVALENRGNTAGPHHNIPLGDVEAPRVITGASVVAELKNLKRVLEQQHAWVDGNMFLIVPSEFNIVLAKFNLANNAWLGGSRENMAVDGKWSHEIMGFTVYETYLPSNKMDSGQDCYNILAGHRGAFAYASGIISSRLVQEIDTFSTIYQMQAVWGGAMLCPCHMVLGYWYFDVTA
jgi:hypothetical protein